MAAGVKERGRIVLGGIRDSAQKSMELIDRAAVGLGEWMKAHGLDTSSIDKAMADAAKKYLGTDRFDLPEVAQPRTEIGRGLRKTTEFVTDFVGLGKIAGTAKKGRAVWKFSNDLIRSEIATYKTFGPYEERMADLWQDLGLPQNVLTDWLAADPDDSLAEDRFKSAIEGALPSVVFAAFRPVARLLREFRRAHLADKALKQAERLGQALKSKGAGFGVEGITEGAVRPAKDIPAYVSDIVRGAPLEKPLPRFVFDLGVELPETLSRQALKINPEFRKATSWRVTISNQVVDKLYRKNAREADRLLADLPELLINAAEVLPDHQNTGRILLARPFRKMTGKDINQVGVIELARRADGFEVVSIHMSPDNTLDKARALLRNLLGKTGSGRRGNGSSSGVGGTPPPHTADRASPIPAAGASPEKQAYFPTVHTTT